MSLDECMANHTEKQILVWLEWLDQQMNVPSRTDTYLMQVAAELVRGQVKSADKRKIKINDFRIKFVRDDEKPNPVDVSRKQLAAFIQKVGQPILMSRKERDEKRQQRIEKKRQLIKEGKLRDPLAGIRKEKGE